MRLTSSINARRLAGVCFLAGLLAFACSLPLLQPPEYARLAAVAASIIGACIVVAARLASQDGLVLPRGPLLPIAGLFLAVMMISAADAVIPFSALIAASTFLIFPCCCLIVLLSPAPPVTRAAVYRGGGIAMAMLAALAVVQFCLFPDLLVNHRVQFPFASPNAYAALLALGFFPGTWRRADAAEKAAAGVFHLGCFVHRRHRRDGQPRSAGLNGMRRAAADLAGARRGYGAAADAQPRAARPSCGRFSLGAGGSAGGRPNLARIHQYSRGANGVAGRSRGDLARHGGNDRRASSSRHRHRQLRIFLSGVSFAGGHGLRRADGAQ